MKTVILALLLLGSSAFAKSASRPFTCKGEDVHTGNVKAVIKGEVVEEYNYGQTFIVGDFTFKIKEPGKPVYEATMKLAISEQSNVSVMGKEPLFSNGSSVFDLGPLAMGGNFTFWNLDRTGAFKIRVQCKGLFN